MTIRSVEYKPKELPSSVIRKMKSIYKEMTDEEVKRIVATATPLIVTYETMLCDEVRDTIKWWNTEDYTEEELRIRHHNLKYYISLLKTLFNCENITIRL